MVHPHDRDDGSPDLEVYPDWINNRWVRPVVALVKKSATAIPAYGRTALPYEPVVTDDCGELYPVSAYLDMLLGDLRESHCGWWYFPELDGPVTSAPDIHSATEPWTEEATIRADMAMHQNLPSVTA
jgi:hypothetical protein